MSRTGLHPTRTERDACGVGFVADVHGRSSRALIDAALTGLARMRHRGAVAADGRSGDGAGLLLPLPTALLASAVAASTPRGGLGAAMCLLDGQEDAAGDRARARARAAVERACAASGLKLLGWRVVPTDERALGPIARASAPRQEQAVFLAPDDGDASERRCYVARRRAEAACRALGVRAYFASWSTRTIVYKALTTADRLADYLPDLADPRVTGWFALFHQRYSTNTRPSWELAQPFRLAAHNGEINTIDGNINQLRARAGRLGADWPELAPEGEALLDPLTDPAASDSACLDAALELLVRGGRDLAHAATMLLQPAWEGRSDLDPEVVDLHRYSAALMEPWDGPAGVVLADGRRVAAALDRNGLRPLRYQVAEDGLVACASEIGAVPLDGRGRIRRERLGPGQVLVVDPADGGLLEDLAVKQRLARRRPYGRWLRANQRTIGAGRPVEAAGSDLVIRKVVAGLTKEDETAVLRPMANDGSEPISSMGDDTALAVLAERPRTVYHHLKQRFAQVTNPPIDHLRERSGMSLRTQLGARAPLLTETSEAAWLLTVDGFLLHPQGLAELVSSPPLPLRAAELDATWPTTAGAEGLAQRLVELAAAAQEVVEDGAALLVLSDRAAAADRAPAPALLALGAVHQRLIATGLRSRCSIVVDTDDAWEPHAFAVLLGYGADAICPRLALETIADLAAEGRLGRDRPSPAEAQERYGRAVHGGVAKILAKMGVSTLDGYRGAQLFEALGLGADVIDLCLGGTPSPLGGVGLAELAADVLERHAQAHAGAAPASPGFYKHRQGGDYHANNPAVVTALQRAVGLAGGTPPAPDLGPSSQPPATRLLAQALAEGRFELYTEFARLVDERPPSAPRDLLQPVGRGSVPLDQVEPASSIVQRFFTGAMSLGALSPEAHETLAAAMNLIGGRSNCGEGGEDRVRFASRGTAGDVDSRVKQVASGRFGVTPEYLVYADELQIKMAQGAKPGEGGQLPGHKVTARIAALRSTQPGTTLISPPPHHDIYSIEDLAQLIFDLKQVNPYASVSVKLVSSSGVGTVAAGVVKGLADAIQIAGGDGGTGAATLGSIKHAGLPWEIGLAETQQTLVREGLRGRVRLQVDGGLRTGRDVLLAALLGADEYGFGTAALIAEGCILARACHRDSCPVGVATQRPDLRARFPGRAEMVAIYLLLVAEDVRRHLARLGLRSIEEAIGRVDLLRPRTDLPAGARAAALDLSALLADPAPADPAEDRARSYTESLPIQAPHGDLGDRLFADAFPSLWSGSLLSLRYEIGNTDRAVGARLGGAIALEHGSEEPDGRVTARFSGQAGQSFGAFLTPGVELDLEGEANDYVGKGMAGGRIVVRPPADDLGDPVLVGNTVLYGATGGELFVAGRAGERFAVRNSGATAVVEGVGDHACEYMTGGLVVILGPTGLNVGAGMTGGELYVLDPGGAVRERINPGSVVAGRPDLMQLAALRELLVRHHRLTGSAVAAAVLASWERSARQLWRIAAPTQVDAPEVAVTGAVGVPG